MAKLIQLKSSEGENLYPNTKNLSMTVGLKQNYVIKTQDSTEEVTGFTYRSGSINTSLTAVTNGIKIGAGVSRVKVSYKASYFTVGTPRRGYTYLRHNTQMLTQEAYMVSSDITRTDNGINNIYFNVNQNDVIGLSIYGGKDHTLVGSTNVYWGTILTVEVIE